MVFSVKLKLPEGQRGQQLSCDNMQLFNDKNLTDVAFRSEVLKENGHHLMVFSRLLGLLFSQEVTLIQPNSDCNCVQSHLQVYSLFHFGSS